MFVQDLWRTLLLVRWCSFALAVSEAPLVYHLRHLIAAVPEAPRPSLFGGSMT
jgi:hypothetical protein